MPNKDKTHHQEAVERTPQLFLLGRQAMAPEKVMDRNNQSSSLQSVTPWLCQVGLESYIWRVDLLNTNCHLLHTP